jgi:hypothetical protein
MMAVCCSSVIATGFSWLYPCSPTEQRMQISTIFSKLDQVKWSGSRTDLVARISDHTAFFGERLERVARNEPSGLDVVTLEHLQQTADTDSPGEKT